MKIVNQRNTASLGTRLSLEKKFRNSTQFRGNFETIAVECSGILKRVSLIEDDILSNPRQIQVYKLINQLGYIV